ncbi:glutamate decarboxylase isoform X1 [Neodiprion virginianus]|uniref:Glutamate decarboxylase isoform X1 n=2 Tax=Neodiprion lecontei TaxID=441921 RepID=A0A6J0BMS2_NEOLC|nr:glutamate decarboxylase isoform X1 [Neodiprion lecontei]XP_046420312.1 glutamate decarboxylase isoform X1 [Neodiprion fabricii]XP_046617581.1 glutamate decarboxylase isoform X1 [Neodiprion virginianus]
MDNVQMIGTKITAIKEYLYNFARTHSPTRLMSSENTYALSKEHCNLKYSDILPQNAEGFPATKEFLMKVVDILIDFVKSTNDRNAKVLEFHHPADMRRLLDLEVPDSGVTLQQLLLDCSTTLKYQVKTGHPHFFNQLSCGLDLVSMAGEWLTATANTNMFTYEIAPVFILMENIVLRKMRELIGWNCGDSVLAPGGSISNLYAFLTARHKMFPTYKERGLAALGGQLVMFTSDQCHYSVKSCASVCGLGTDNCVMVPSDARGRMIPSKLEELILERKARGHVPFFVNATAGTTVIGAFDPIPEIADICQKYELWLHVDAAWGGGLLLSRKYRHPRLTGIERADSVTWNPHKLMGALLQCSTIHFKEDGLLISCNRMSAEYLFMVDKLYDVQYDTGDKVIQCGRHNDIFKLWLQWRAKGTDGFEKHMDRLMELSEYMVRRIKQMPDKFYLILEPEMVNVCFWYLPTRVRNMPHSAEREKILGETCPVLKDRMMKAGTLMVGYQPDDRRPNFFRNIISSAAVTEADVDFLLTEMDRLGHDL